MNVTRIKIKDYNGIAHADVDLSKCPHLTMIAGRTRSAGASSNGSGKTSFVNALPWCLFGKEIQRPGPDRRNASSMIREGAPFTRVEVWLSKEGKPYLHVARERRRSGSTSLFINGKQASTAQGGQQQIERALGFTYELFCKTVVFGGDLSSFCRLSPIERTRVLEEMLGVNNYSEAADAAKQRARELTQVADQIESRIIEQEQEEARALGDFRGMIDVALSNKVAWRKKQARLLRDIRRCHNIYEAKLRVLDERYRESDTDAQEYESAHAKWEKGFDRLYSNRDALVSACNAASAKLDAVLTEIKQVTAHIKQLETKEHPDVCPTCRRKWPHTTEPQDTSGLRRQLLELCRTRENREGDLVVAREKVKLIESEIAMHKMEAPAKPQKANRVAEAMRAVHEAEMQLHTAMTLVEQLEEPDPWTDINASYARLRAVRSKREDLGDKLLKQKRAASVQRFWEAGFGRDGIPAVLLESAAPALNRSAQKYIRLLTSGAYTMAFSVAEEGKAGLRIEASNIDGGSNYADLSKGETARVDLCALLAVRDLMRNSAPTLFSQVWIDELLDGLDDEGVSLSTRLLRSKEIADQVFFVSHNGQLQEAADGVILVSKENGVATVSSGASIKEAAAKVKTATLKR